MASKMVTAQQKRAEEIKASVRTHGAAIVAELRAGMARRGVADATLEGLFAYLCAEVDASLAAAAEADAAHAAELADDHAPREARDVAVARLRDDLTSLRGTTTSLYGELQAKALAFPAEMPREAAQLERVAIDVVGALRTKELPAPRVAGVGVVATGPWITLLEADLAAVAAARAALTREAEEARATQAAKDQGLAALTQVMVATAQVTLGLARLTGTTGLVAGLRGTIDRRAPKSPDAPANDASDEAPKRGASVPPAAPKGGAAKKPRAAAARRKR